MAIILKLSQKTASAHVRWNTLSPVRNCRNSAGGSLKGTVEILQGESLKGTVEILQGGPRKEL